MQTAAGLISRIIKLTAGMQGRKYQTFGTHPFCVHLYRHTAAVVFHGSGTVFFQGHFDLAAVPGQMLVHRVVHDLIHQMVQTFCGYTADIHSRTYPDGFQPFEYDDILGAVTAVVFFLCHSNLLNQAIFLFYNCVKHLIRHLYRPLSLREKTRRMISFLCQRSGTDPIRKCPENVKKHTC